ncbi:MAG: hypothetical protein ACWGOY_13465 [Anaerolineales bacterium]
MSIDQSRDDNFATQILKSACFAILRDQPFLIANLEYSSMLDYQR